MESNVDRLGRRMVELNNALQDKRTNPDYGFENVKSVDMLIKFVITLDGSENGINDGIYIYMNESALSPIISQTTELRHTNPHKQCQFPEMPVPDQ